MVFTPGAKRMAPGSFKEGASGLQQWQKSRAKALNYVLALHIPSL